MLAFAMIATLLPVASAAKSFEKAHKWEDGDFTDIPAEEWFFQNVRDAFELGLMKGAGAGKFNPLGNISLAEAITVAARIHSLATTGEEKFEQGNPWYQVYADYALENGIISSIPANITSNATRLQFAEILANALPESDLAAINTVDDGIIPDVASNAAVYKLYRAGVLTGGDDKGTFSPSNSISRAEVSAIVARMALPETRIRRDLKKAEEKEENKSTPNVSTMGGGGSSSASKPQKPAKSEISADVEVDESGKTKNEVSMSGEKVNATVPAGVAVNEGAEKLVLTVEAMEETGGNIETGEDETLSSYDVHIDGVSDENTVAIKVFLGDILPAGMNLGNITLYHIENEATNAMTQVATLDDLDAHNEFYYDPATGNITVALASFSEIAVVAEEAKWEGEFDYTWYDASKTELTIANADQLAGFGAIVGEMAKDKNGNYICTIVDESGNTIHYDSFKGKTVKLIADINLGDNENANESLIFHPIGYYYTDDKNEDGTTGDYYSTVGSFEGTFDGNGHTIANFYQNTWEIKGDYDGNYYKDAMGLFGYVVGSRDADGNPTGGIIKNLTVDNFSSDGEFTPTGVIAAYAVNSTFENIAITNCNPRVYNTGNGGIVGIGGNSDDPDTYKLTFNNITIDNTNKVTALWGSWDVACGGLVGMFRGAGHVYMTNCHVAAQLDVYNDVCGNYQYYWYRYSGMMVGTNKNMVTDADGYTVPETTKYHAENCTVHFGTWNDYYYCELVANSLASYTHDHQFSRLEQIKSLDEIKSGDTWTKTGNFLLISGDTKTCYHIINKDGRLTQHLHTDAGEETVNGETVLKENNQIIYLPFNQLFTGYGWGVKHIPVYNGKDYAFEGITILDREVANSVNKFKKADTAQDTYTTDSTVTIGELFTVIENAGVAIDPKTVYVSVNATGETSTANAIYTANENDWTQGTLTFSGTGAATITIKDYYFCAPTTINVTVTDRSSAEKFDVVMNNGDFLHRVGNSGTVALDKLFKAKEGVTIGTVSVTVEAVNGTSASGTYSNNAIQFNGTGVVKVTITDNDYCTPTELYLEVVDAVNATSATNATENNVVLLNDCGFSSFEVSGGYTLYGNGFTMTCGSDSVAADLGYSFVKLDNGTLDNVQIVCPNFDYAALYKSNLTSSDNRSTTENDKTRYYNARSGVMASGNSQILNSRISGARAAVNVSGGNVLIENSRIELGAVASILVGSANSLTLRDVTLVQKPTASTYDSSKTLMGFSVLTICDGNGNSTPITLEGTLVQNAWIDEDDTKYVPEDGKSIISTVLKKTEYLHDIDGDGTKESLNLGFAYMPESSSSKVSATTITDSRSNQNSVPYDYAEVSILIGTTYVYSYKSTNGTADSFKTESTYIPNKYGDIITVTYSDTTDGLTTGKSFGTDGWVYELNVDLDKLSGYALDFSKLAMSVNGVPVTDFKVNGSAKPTSPVAVTAGGTTYTLTATIDGKEYVSTYKVTGTETSKESPSLVAANYEAGLCVASSYGGTWHGAAPALEGIRIKYWSVAENQDKTITLSDYTPTTAGKQNGTNTTWTYSPANGDFTLTLTGGQVHSSNNVYAMPVVCDGKLYFVAASSSGLVNSGNSARSIAVSYSFKDNNSGDELTFSHTWSVAENKDAQYKYSDFCNGTLTKLEDESCFTEGTLITLADGTRKAVEDLEIGDMLLVFNHVTGQAETAPLIFNTHTEATASLYDVLHLQFSNGEEVEVVQSHGFFDTTEMQYVYIDYDNYNDYIGHTFYMLGENGREDIELVNAYVEEEYTRIFCPVTYFHMNSFANNFLNTPNIPGDLTGLVNYFEYDLDLKYNEEAMQRDIEKYGLYTYDDFKDYISYEAYLSSPSVYLKVAVGKEMITYEQIIDVINYLLEGSLID